MKLPFELHRIKEFNGLGRLPEESLMRSSALVYLTISLLLIASIPTGIALTKDYKSTWTDLTVSGGQSLLVEELTAYMVFKLYGY